MIKLVGVIIEDDTDIRSKLEEFWDKLAGIVREKHNIDMNDKNMAWAIGINKSVLFPLIADCILKKGRMEQVVDAIVVVHKQAAYMDSVYQYALDHYKVDFSGDSITEAVVPQLPKLLPKINDLVARNASLDEGYRLIMGAVANVQQPTGGVQ